MGIGEIDDDAHGITTPRIFTPPLRELTPATSNGYAVIEFARKVSPRASLPVAEMAADPRA